MKALSATSLHLGQVETGLSPFWEMYLYLSRWLGSLSQSKNSSVLTSPATRTGSAHGGQLTG